jgi:hypothetical protein
MILETQKAPLSYKSAIVSKPFLVIVRDPLCH